MGERHVLCSPRRFGRRASPAGCAQAQKGGWKHAYRSHRPASAAERSEVPKTAHNSTQVSPAFLLLDTLPAVWLGGARGTSHKPATDNRRCVGVTAQQPAPGTYAGVETMRNSRPTYPRTTATYEGPQLRILTIVAPPKSVPGHELQKTWAKE